jgi:hypothetical protein
VILLSGVPCYVCLVCAYTISLIQPPPAVKLSFLPIQQADDDYYYINKDDDYDDNAHNNNNSIQF